MLQLVLPLAMGWGRRAFRTGQGTCGGGCIVPPPPPRAMHPACVRSEVSAWLIFSPSSVLFDRHRPCCGVSVSRGVYCIPCKALSMSCCMQCGAGQVPSSGGRRAVVGCAAACGMMRWCNQVHIQGRAAIACKLDATSVRAAWLNWLDGFARVSIIICGATHSL